MKRAFILLSLFVLVACEQGKQIMSVVTPEQPDDTAELVDDTTETLPLITFENVFELKTGQRYRIIPTEVNGGNEPELETKIWDISFGSIGGYPPVLLEGYTDNDPKFKAWFSMSNAINYLNEDAKVLPYALTTDGKKVIEEGDEIVIEIVSQEFAAVEQEGGTRNNKFVFTLVEYSAILIENLTNPDRTFEY